MDIETINDVVFKYLVKMIKNDDIYDIYNISEDEFDDIKNKYLNNWIYGYDIITEYFGNQQIFTPTIKAFISMVIHCNAERISDEMCDIITEIICGVGGQNYNLIYANALRHYAYHYINCIDYDVFLKVLKKYVLEDE